MDRIVSEESKQKTVLLTFLGVGLLTASAQVKIPIGPIPFTMQTFAILLIALTQTPKQALLSSLAYLFCGTVGLPVFASGANPYWMTGKAAGYLFAFPLSCWITSFLKERCSPLFSSICGQIFLYLVGFLWLIPFLGYFEALYYGVVLFIPSNIVKIAMAITLAKRIRR